MKTLYFLSNLTEENLRTSMILYILIYGPFAERPDPRVGRNSTFFLRYYNTSWPLRLAYLSPVAERRFLTSGRKSGPVSPWRTEYHNKVGYLPIDQCWIKRNKIDSLNSRDPGGRRRVYFSRNPTRQNPPHLPPTTVMTCRARLLHCCSTGVQ